MPIFFANLKPSFLKGCVFRNPFYKGSGGLLLLKNKSRIPSFLVEAEKDNKVSSFNELSAEERSEANDFIENINSQLSTTNIVSIDQWCTAHNVPSEAIIKLLNKNSLPVLKLQKFKGAYSAHMQTVLELEYKRQFRKKAENKAVRKHNRLSSS